MKCAIVLLVFTDLVSVGYITYQYILIISWVYNIRIYLTFIAVLNINVSDNWILGNIQQYGIYRVNYDIDNWDNLIKQLKNNYSVRK